MAQTARLMRAGSFWRWASLPRPPPGSLLVRIGRYPARNAALLAFIFLINGPTVNSLAKHCVILQMEPE